MTDYLSHLFGRAADTIGSPNFGLFFERRVSRLREPRLASHPSRHFAVMTWGRIYGTDQFAVPFGLGECACFFHQRMCDVVVRHDLISQDAIGTDESYPCAYASDGLDNDVSATTVFADERFHCGKSAGGHLDLRLCRRTHCLVVRVLCFGRHWPMVPLGNLRMSRACSVPACRNEPMRAIEIRENGGPDVLTPIELPEPVPGSGELLVRVEAAGVNFIDTYFRSGQYSRPLPYVPGDEGAGIVEHVGPDVTEFVVGQRVVWASAPGSYAEMVVVPARVAVAVPDGVPAEEAASALLQGMTAHYLIESTYPAAPGETVLVHAGAGGVGLLLTQLAVAKGVHVITTVSTSEKENLSRAAGARDVLRYEDDIAERVRALTDGEGVHAVYDGVGAATFEQSLASLRVRGTLALFGAASGPVPPFDPQRLNAAGSIFLTRPTLGHHVRDRSELEWRAGAVFKAVVDGVLDIRVGASFPLADAAAAHTDLESRRTTGSIVLVP